MRRGARALAVLALLAAAALPLRAQSDVAALAEACSGGVETLHPTCLEAALAVQGVQAGVGSVHAGGSDLPGSASTVGKRGGASPRIVIHGRLAGARMARPEIADAPGRGHGEQEATPGALEGGVTVGIFGGFNPAPTVGGVLSLDLRASGARLLLPGGTFDESVWGWGVGARVGILRESLTLPGVSVSIDRRRVGEVGSGEAFGVGAPGRVVADVTTTSIRGTVGKDLFGVGVLLGAGWDRYESEGSVAPPSSTPVPFDDFTSERTLLFGGLTWHFLVLDLSVEGGWASGFDTPEGRAPSAYDPGEGRLFGSAAFRFTY